MRVRLRYALPLAQMALAVVFLRLIFLWDVATRGDDMPGRHPAFQVLIYLHLPLMLVFKELLFGRLPELAVLVAAIGGFWYWIALLVHRYNERRTIFPPAWGTLRIVADLALITMGASIGWLSIENIRDYPDMYSPLPQSFLGWSWFIPTYGFLLMWILSPIVVFGSDLVQYLRRKSPHTVNSVNE